MTNERKAARNPIQLSNLILSFCNFSPFHRLPPQLLAFSACVCVCVFAIDVECPFDQGNFTIALQSRAPLATPHGQLMLQVCVCVCFCVATPALVIAILLYVGRRRIAACHTNACAAFSYLPGLLVPNSIRIVCKFVHCRIFYKYSILLLFYCRRCSFHRSS